MSAMTSPAAPPTIRPPIGLTVFWIVCAVLGGVVSSLLYLEYIGQLTGSDALISCSISAIVTCGPNLLAPAGNLLGFSNSIIGIALFFGPLYAAMSALASNGLRPWYWRVYVLFIAAGFVFVHVLAWRSVFEFRSLCPWCMVVWLVTIPLFWFTLGWSLRDGVWGADARRIGSAAFSWALLLTVLDYAVIAVAAQVQLDVLSSLF